MARHNESDYLAFLARILSIILNVYAPNLERGRQFLWDELVASLPSSCRRVLIGDWNMVQVRRDKSNIDGSLLTGSKKVSFEELLLILNVAENLSSPNGFKYF